MGQLHPMELGGHQIWEARGSQIWSSACNPEMPRKKGGGGPRPSGMWLLGEVMSSSPWRAPFRAARYQHA